MGGPAEKHRIQDRRRSIRLEVSPKALCTLFDNRGRPGRQAPLRSLDLSSGGARFRSDFLVIPGQTIEVTLSLGPHLIFFMGRVVHVTPSEGQGFEFGVHIEHIENEDRITLTKFLIQGFRKTIFENRILRVDRKKDLESRSLSEPPHADSFCNL